MDGFRYHPPMIDPIPTRVQINHLIEHSLYLRSPSRKTGPSPHEAEDDARDCMEQAERLSEALFYSEAERTRGLYL